MNKKSIMEEILEVNERYKFIAGNRLRQLPLNHEETPPAKTLKFISSKETYSNLDKRTINNLNRLNFLFEIDWFFVMKYKVIKGRNRLDTPNRYSWIIYGLMNGELVTFFRKETTSPCAGQTFLYFGHGNRIQPCKLISIEDKEYREKFHMTSFNPQSIMTQIKSMYKYTRSPILSKYILKYT